MADEQEGTENQGSQEYSGDKGEEVGEVFNYFEKPSVAAIKLTGSLKVGDKIRIVGGEDTDFEQEVDSMQVEHESVEEANAGQGVGLKVKEKVREGYKVYKVE